MLYRGAQNAILLGTVLCLASVGFAEPPANSYGPPSSGYSGGGSNGGFSGSSGGGYGGSGNSGGGSGGGGGGGSGYGGGNGHGYQQENYPPRPYKFNYAVNDHYSGANFRQMENSDGNKVNGQYTVLLPDGRTQIVTYNADWKNGFNAEVTYQGEARYPEPKNYGPPPVQSYSAPSSSYGSPSGGSGPTGGYAG